MANEGKELVGRIREYLKKTDLADGLLVFVEENSDPYAARITGIENSTPTALYIPKNGPSAGITYGMEYESLKNTGVLDDVQSYDKPRQFKTLVKRLINGKRTAANFSAKDARADFLTHDYYEWLKKRLEEPSNKDAAFVSSEAMWKELGYCGDGPEENKLTGSGRDARLARMVQLKEKFDGLVLVGGAGKVNDILLSYISGVKHARRAALVVADGTGTLIVHESESDKISRNEFDNVIVYDRNEQFGELLSGSIAGQKRTLYNPSTVTEGNYRILSSDGKKPISVKSRLSKIRAVKLKSEADSIRKSCSALDEIVNETFSEISAGDTERKIYDNLIGKIGSRGLEVDFNPIVAIGKNSSNIHHLLATDEKAENGKNILIDAGVFVDGMASDKTYNGFFGEPTKDYVEAHDAVEKALLAALSKVKAGVKGKLPDRVARNVLKKSGYPDFEHSTGHSLGFADHDAGTGLRSHAEDALPDGEVVTIEPGIYYENKYGIRIETDVLVTKKGAELLSPVPKLMVKKL